MTLKKIIVWSIALILIIILSILSFYVYMIYGTHSWDEGSTWVSCEKDPNSNQMVLVEKTVLKDGIKVKIAGTDRDCDF